MDEKEALNDVIATQPGDSRQSVASSEVLGFASEVRQQFSNVRQQFSELRQQMLTDRQQNTEFRQQNSELTQQVSVLSSQVYSMLSTLMVQTEELQQMKSGQQYSYSLSATDMQHATTAERQALMDDTYHRVQVAAAVADIGAPQLADDGTKHNAAMFRQMSTMQSAGEQTRTAENLLLERLEQLAESKQ